MVDSEDTFGVTTFYCDYPLCGEEYAFEGAQGKVDFQGAVMEAKENGWLMKNVEGQWLHFSSEKCYEDYLDSKGL